MTTHHVIADPVLAGMAALAALYLLGLVVYLAVDTRQHRQAVTPVSRWLDTGDAQPDAPTWLMAADAMAPALRDHLSHARRAHRRELSRRRRLVGHRLVRTHPATTGPAHTPAQAR